MDNKLVDFAIEECINGRSPEELKLLYKYPYRNQVPWHKFPEWARPDIIPEECHEG